MTLHSRWRHILSTVLMISVVMSTLALVGVVRAAPPSNITFQPGTVSNLAASAIVVTGTDIAANAQVVLDGFGALNTTEVTTGTLSATIPAGIPVGTYTVRVVNPNGESGTAGTPLTVTGSTATPLPTNTPAPTAFTRPQLVVISYGASSPTIAPGADYDFEMTLQNAGNETATNIVAEFADGDFLPRVTGGIRAVGNLAPGEAARFFQPLYATRALAEKRVATLEVKVTYTTSSGTSYTDNFTLTFPVVIPPSSPAKPTATPTARPVFRPQLVVTSYRSDTEPLQPGSQFTLELNVVNSGNTPARRLTMIVGGGTVSASDVITGTGSSGVSGGSASFTDFAPVQSSNVQALGELEAGATLTARQRLIVNATTKAGAYPLKISFAYLDDRGTAYVDDQVVTLLVYQAPQVEISFYRDVGPLLAGQPSTLPVQVVNLGRNSVVLGNLKVMADRGEFSNNILFIGALEPGGTFPLDANFTPEAPGPVEIVVTVDYTDDFNQPQVITATLTLEVLESGPGGEPGGPDGGGFPIEPPVEQPETAGEMFLRFLSGFFGLDSARPQPTVFPNGGLQEVPVEPLPGPKGCRWPEDSRRTSQVSAFIFRLKNALF